MSCPIADCLLVTRTLSLNLERQTISFLKSDHADANRHAALRDPDSHIQSCSCFGTKLLVVHPKKSKP
jgi:hypothetical protein